MTPVYTIRLRKVCGVHINGDFSVLIADYCYLSVKIQGYYVVIVHEEEIGTFCSGSLL